MPFYFKKINAFAQRDNAKPTKGETTGPGAGCALCLCRRNAQRDGVAVPGLLGRFGFWRRVHLSFSGNPLPAGRGRTHLRNLSGLPAKFPEDLWLQQIGAESYIGVPMRNAQGRTLGHLAVLHQEPMEPSEEDIAVLQIFAARGCAELERKQAHEKLSKAHEDLRRLNLETAALLNVNRAIGHHLNRDVLFGALADVLTKRDVLSENLQSKVFPSAGTATAWVLQNREWLVAGSWDEMRDRFPATARVMNVAGMQSWCELPLLSGVRVLGSLIFMSSKKAAYAHLQHSFLQQVASSVAVALDDCLAHEEVRRLGNELSARTIPELERQQRRMSNALQEASKALETSEERFRDLFDEAPIAYVHEGLGLAISGNSKTSSNVPSY